MVTLCPTSYEIAQKMDNFSGWVRQQVLKLSTIQEEIEYNHYQCPACWKRYQRNASDTSEMYCFNKDCGYIKPLKKEESE